MLIPENHGHSISHSPRTISHGPRCCQQLDRKFQSFSFARASHFGWPFLTTATVIPCFIGVGFILYQLPGLFGWRFTGGLYGLHVVVPVFIAKVARLPSARPPVVPFVSFSESVYFESTENKKSALSLFECLDFSHFLRKPS